MVSFGERLKQIRTENNLTQLTVCKKCQIGIRTYKSYEAGEVQPTASVIIKLSQYFQVSADYILGLSDDRTIHSPVSGEDTGQPLKAKE